MKSLELLTRMAWVNLSLLTVCSSTLGFGPCGPGQEEGVGTLAVVVKVLNIILMMKFIILVISVLWKNKLRGGGGLH